MTTILKGKHHQIYATICATLFPMDEQGTLFPKDEQGFWYAFDPFPKG